MAERLASANSNVRKIALFGSLAAETHTPRSDADILILLREDSRRFMDRIPEFLRAFRDARIPVDVFPYTEAEFARLLAEENPFALRVQADLIPLI